MTDKTTMTMGILAVVVAVFALLIAVVPVVMDQGIVQGQEKETVSVQGNSVISTSPDELQVDISIETKGPTPTQVQGANKEISNNVIAKLKELGLTEDELETTQYRLQEWTEWTRDSGQKHLGHIQYHTLRVTTKKLDLAGKIADEAVKAGANRVQNIQFKLSNEKHEKVLSEALSAASGKARAKAEALAKPLGLRVKGVVSVSDNSRNYGPPVAYLERSAMMAMDEDVAEPAPQILEGELEVRGNVQVVFKVG